MSVAKKKSQRKWLKKLVPAKKIVLVGLILLLILVSLISFVVYLFRDRVYPGVFVAGVDLSAQTSQQAVSQLKESLTARLITLNFYHGPTLYQISLTPDSFEADFEGTLSQALEYGHQKIYFQKVSLPLKLKLTDSLKESTKAIAQAVDQPPINSQLKVEGDQINATPSQDGLVVDTDKLNQIITHYLNTGQLTDNNLPIKKVSPKLSYQQALKIKNRLDQIKLAPLKLVFKDLSFTLNLETILSLIDLEQSESNLAVIELFDEPVEVKSISINSEEISDVKLTLNKKRLNDYLNDLASQIDRPVEEPLFSFDPSAGSGQVRVTEFRPPQEGRKLDLSKSYDKISQALITPGQTVVNLSVETIAPKNKLTNDLGIKELLGRGISHFTGSIANRIYNIELTAKKINGILVAPAEIFSFNNAVGDISSASGFRQAYVIKSGRTVLDDGGGVCQDSTTLFRAVLNAGLPVLKRTAHAYRVGYYEQGFPPGLDATVYAPSVDFQFKNDTGAHILIQAYTSGNSLYVDLYGTSDGRVATISTPIVSNQTPPPPELRQEDPTLPKGTVKQVDFSAWGASVVFSRTVKRGGEILINETYRSNFRPWQAIYLVGTGG